MKTWQSVLLGFFIGILASAGIYLIAAQPHGTPVELISPRTPGLLMVDITGAVNSPGVFYMPQGSRLLDAVQEAGGVTSEADLNVINLAAPIHDGEKIYIPYIADNFPKPIPSPFFTQTSQQININTATAADLTKLPGIGEERAFDIINYREANGPFLNIEDIQNVPGIGAGIFEQIKNLITVSE